MANRKATFAKRQRETELKDRARAKEARRAQLRDTVSSTKGPQIAWDEAVHATTTSELPSLSMANQRREDSESAATAPASGKPPGEAPAGEAPANDASASGAPGSPGVR